MSDTPQTPPAKGGRLKLVVIAGVVAALAGGGAAYWFLQKPVEAADTAHHAEPAPARGLVAFDPFVVNLADPGVARFLRVSMQLVVKDAEQATELQESKVALMQARSAILDVLTTQTSDVLVTPEGKTKLRAAVIETLHHTIEEFEVVDVLFSDFVVQF